MFFVVLTNFELKEILEMEGAIIGESQNKEAIKVLFEIHTS